MVRYEIERFIEPLEADELRFLQRKEAQERHLFYKVVRLLMILCFMFPYLVALARAFSGVRNPFSVSFYFLLVVSLLIFTGTCLFLSYRLYLRRTQRDISSGVKLIERAHVTRKLYMPHNDTYHLYLDSPTRLSIEVDEPDYRRFIKGDEVNIEYTSISKQYLGYF